MAIETPVGRADSTSLRDSLALHFPRPVNLDGCVVGIDARLYRQVGEYPLSFSTQAANPQHPAG